MLRSLQNVLAFHWSIIRDAWEDYHQRKSKVDKAVALLLAAVSAALPFNERIGRLIMDNFQPVPQWLSWSVPVALLVFAFLKANHDHFLRKEREAADQMRERDRIIQEKDQRIQTLANRLRPQMEIVFDEDRFRSCRMEWTDPTSPVGRMLGADIKVRMFRVAIVNSGGTTVEGVRLQLRAFTPQGAPFLPIEMHFMNDDTEDFRLSRMGVSLQPGEKKLVDIVQKSQDSPEMVLLYATRGRPNTIPTREYLLNLVALGRDVPPVEAQFLIRPDDDNLLFFQAVSTNDSSSPTPDPSSSRPWQA